MLTIRQLPELASNPAVADVRLKGNGSKRPDFRISDGKCPRYCADLPTTRWTPIGNRTRCRPSQIPQPGAIAERLDNRMGILNRGLGNDPANKR